MYYLFHFGIPLLIAVGVGVLLYRYRPIRMKWRIFAAVSVIIIAYLLQCFPPENLFMRFETPEAAFQYTSNRRILQTVEGKESSIVFYQSSEGTSWCAMRKTENGYTVPAMNAVLPQRQGETISSELPVFCRQCDFTIQRYRSTNDYYLFITASIEAENPQIEDNRADEVPCIFDPIGYSHMIIICVPFDGYPQDYILTVNGEEILKLN